MPEPDDFMTVAEVATILKLNQQTVRKTGSTPESSPRCTSAGGSAKRLKKWTARAESLGWAATDRHGKPWSLAKSRGKPLIDGVGRPSAAAGISRLAMGDEESRIGDYLWSRLSAVSHVTWFGLHWAMMLDDVRPNLTPGLSTVPVGTDASAVSLQAFCIVRALRQAATARFALMGWEDDEWKTACDLAEKHERELFRAFEAGLPASAEEQAEQEGP